MEAFVFRFSAGQLRKIPRKYLGFCIASSHCCNELAILLPYLIFEHNLNKANEVESAFIVMRRYTIQHTLNSKIVEYDKLCSKYFKNADSSTDNFMRECWFRYKPIAKLVGSAKWAKILRNKMSFHFDIEHAVSSLDSLDDQHRLRLIAGKTKGLTICEFAEEIIGRPIFEQAGDGNIETGMKAVSEFMVELVGLITSYNSKMTTDLFREYGVIPGRDTVKIRDAYCGDPSVVKIPISPSFAFLNERRMARGLRLRKT